MEGRNLTTFLSYHCLTGNSDSILNYFFPFFGLLLLVFFELYNCHTFCNMLLSIDLVGPLTTHPVTEMDETVTKLQLKYTTYIAEYDIEDVICRFPS